MITEREIIGPPISLSCKAVEVCTFSFIELRELRAFLRSSLRMTLDDKAGKLT